VRDAREPSVSQGVNADRGSHVQAALGNINNYYQVAPGSRPALVRSHHDELLDPSGRSRFLTTEALDYVPPPRSDKAHPANLWRLLSAEGTVVRGVLLVGTAGSGKTRTCYEVAALAEAARWRVLHVARDPALSTAQLAEVVYAQQEAEGILLLFDYLDTYTQLSVAELSEFLSDARLPPVACLASVRPGRVEEARKRDSDWILREVPVCEDGDYQRRIVEQIFGVVARDALERLGLPVLLAACGHRPIIALLIAQEIEKRVYQRDPLEGSGLRQGSLGAWLHKRIGEDTASASTRELEARLLAYTAAAAASPRDRAIVERVMGVVLRDHSEVLPDDVLRRFMTSGWLLASGDRVEVVHDIVTDQLLQQALASDGRTISGHATRQLLSALLTDSGAFARAVEHLRRWSADLGSEPLREFERVCEGWLAENVDGVRTCLADPGRRADSGRMLLTMLSAAPWQSALVTQWAALVAPWLAEAEDEEPGLVRDLLLSALEGESDRLPAPLVDTALGWLADHQADPSAYAVIDRLLVSGGLSEEQREITARRAMRWLQDNRDWGTSYVLRGLLVAEDLQPKRRAEAVRKAVRWLPGKERSPAASFVLRPLLERHQLDAEQRRVVLDFAARWLSLHAERWAASFVLAPLALAPDYPVDVIGLASAWAESHRHDPRAVHVPRALLERQSGDWQERRDAVVGALGWLAEHPRVPDAGSLLRTLLKQSYLSSREQEAALGYAFEWLAKHATAEQAAYVYDVIPFDRLDPDRSAWVIQAAYTWLAEHGAKLSASFPLRRLCRLPHEPDALDYAADWLDLHHPAPEAGFVIAPLLTADEPSRHDDLLRHTTGWLKQYGTTPAAWYVLVNLCQPRHLAAEDRAEFAVESALAWFEVNDDPHKAGELVLGLLDLRDLASRLRNRVADRVLESLGDGGQVLNTGALLAGLFRLGQLSGDRQARIVDLALSHMEDLSTKDARLVLAAAMRQTDLQRPHVDRMVTAALAWLDGRGSKAGLVWMHLLARQDLTPEQSSAAVDLAIPWLDRHRSQAVRHALAQIPGLDAERAKRVRTVLSPATPYQRLRGALTRFLGPRG
jgi:hypothetical protein